MKNDLSISNTIIPIGYLHSPLTQKFGIPRQPNLVAVQSTIELVAPYHHPDTVLGLSAFSHIWVLWRFHQVMTPHGDNEFRPLVRPPRLGGNQKIGVFASRSMFRPNHIGMSVLQLDEVVIDNNHAKLIVSGADMVDGTPILDIKPYITYSDSVPDAQSSYADQPPIAKAVTWTESAAACCQQFKDKGVLAGQDDGIIEQLIAQDPRPAYHADKQSDKTYHMRYGEVDVVFYAARSATSGDTIMVIETIRRCADA